MEYAGFWRRFGAIWIDFAIFLPVMVLAYFAGEQFRLFQLYWFRKRSRPLIVFGTSVLTLVLKRRPCWSSCPHGGQAWERRVAA
jgi:hypothetical protein